jgi:hypothetical protein
MTVKTFEIRDVATFIPAVGVLCSRINQDSEQDAFLMRCAGYGPEEVVLLTKLSGGKSEYDPYDWGDRTMTCAHHYIQENFHSLETGAVVDVEYILNETQTPKVSERLT